MQIFHVLRSVSVFISLSGSHALISASPLQPRQTYNCTDLAAVFDSRCWAQLGMVDFLNNPKTGWNATTKTCSTTSDGADCCMTDEPWSTCFLRLAYGTSGSDCTNINSQICEFRGLITGPIDPSVLPQYHYAARAIFEMNDLFRTWYTASESVINQASLIVQPIITEIDPQRKTNLDLLSLSSATIAGLPYLTTPYTENPAGLSYNSLATSRALQNSLQNTPAVARALFPTSTINSQQIAISSLPSSLENSTNQISQLLNNALTLIMTDMPAFIAFTSSGAYTDSTSLSLPLQAPGMGLALKTYILSSALSANGYIAHVTTNASHAAAQAQQKSTFNDGSNGLVFTIGSEGSTQNKISESDFEGVYINNWTTQEALFAGPYTCAEAGWFDGGSVVNFNATGGLDLSCLSRLVECKESGDAGVGGKVQECPGGWTALSG